MPRPPLILCLLLLAAPSGPAAEPISFSRQIRPILSENCFFCHGPDEAKREAGLRLDDETAAKSGGDGAAAIVPGHPEKSALIQRITTTDPDDVMPPPKLHKVITPAQITLLTDWIKQGAPWGNHWSYEPVTKPAPPPLQNPKSEVRNPIDQFLLARLERENLVFSPEAPPHALLRRLALDLTGLPPTLEEIDRFLPLIPANYETVVDHYLASPHYGEHWAAQWMDLARYADSSGYPSDQPREIWAWRDWVVSAFNRNLSFDQFTIEQIAGDLLPGATGDQIIATAFHRNTMTQNEGGTSDEEFRNAAVIDRVNTTMAVWMGTTIACAQCHTHKYDPITITEYYQFYDFLNQTADADKKDESPVHEIIAPELKQQRQAWSRRVAALEKDLAQINPERLEGFAAWLDSKPAANAKLKPLLDKPAEQRTPEDVEQLQIHYVRQVSAATRTQRGELSRFNKKLAETKPVTVPVMVELSSDQRRASHIQNRGEWQNLGAQVRAATPAAFHPLPEDAPRDRLALARWLVSRDNPLTARVTVNRYWEAIFGTGIVRTSEEFGSQGELPFHPELLDWLAADLMDHAWDLKYLLKLLVTSAAYRQDSASNPKSAALNPNLEDPENRLLSRGPRFRPGGELIRDQALAVSGLLSPKMGGPPVRPMTPSLGLSTAFGRSNDWTVSEGEDKHRRSLYTEVRRNAPYASFTTFDAGNREVCMIRRNRTNTPLQAFVTLNDPVFIETHQAMARRLLSAPGLDTDTARLHHLFKLTLCRPPSEQETTALLRTLGEAQAHFAQYPTEAAQLASDPLGPLPQAIPAPQAAAWTTLANIVMNLDEFLMRR